MADSLQQRFSRRATVWQLRTRTLAIADRPLLMGIINVTPDSFSDGGKFFAADAAIARAEQLAIDGADILDIGGESTRPYSTSIAAAEEQGRIEFVVAEVCRRCPLPISIDTSKAAVAQAALDAGAEIINDITGLEGDSQMLEVAQRSQAGLCVMHMQGTPQTMQDAPTYQDVVTDILQYLQNRKDAFIAAGIEPARICLDPGIGFGKTHQHNLTLLANSWRFHTLECPVLVGHSRKGFIAKVLEDPKAERTAATVGVALSLAAQGVQVIRIHDVRPVCEALKLFAATGGIDGKALRLQ